VTMAWKEGRLGPRGGSGTCQKKRVRELNLWDTGKGFATSEGLGKVKVENLGTQKRVIWGKEREREERWRGLRSVVRKNRDAGKKPSKEENFRTKGGKRGEFHPFEGKTTNFVFTNLAP